MKTGSIRIDPYAIWDADKHTGTNKFPTSSRFGVIAR